MVATRSARSCSARCGDDNAGATSGYLARIVFCELVKGDEAERSASGTLDNQHGLLVIDPKEQTVAVEDKYVDGEVLARWTFDEYCALPDIEHVAPEKLKAWVAKATKKGT